MTTRSSLALVLALALAAASACAPKVNDPADVEAIKALMDGYFKAASAKDPAAVEAVVADGTVLLEPNMAPLVGKEAIGRMHQSFMDQFSIDATGPAVDVRVAGDLAVAYGRYEETITPKDGTLAAAHARDMAFFERVLAKEYTQVADGKLVDVAAQLAEMKAGRVEIESITIRDMKVHVAGDAAIVWMTAESKGAYKGKPFSERSKGVDFFARRDGRWQIVNSQMTTIKD